MLKNLDQRSHEEVNRNQPPEKCGWGRNSLLSFTVVEHSSQEDGEPCFNVNGAFAKAFIVLAKD